MSVKFLVAPSAYKGSFSPSQVALAIERGIKAYDPSSTIVLTPIADGGDGTIEALHLSCGGTVEPISVQGPIGKEVDAHYLLMEGDRGNGNDDNFFYISGGEPQIKEYHPLAVVELASACGIAHLKPSELHPLDAHTYGAGQILLNCFGSGFKNVVLTVGGSASTDGGMGILCALGARFLDKHGKELKPGGRQLASIKSIDLTAVKRMKRNVRLRVATDVVNELLGPDGAAAVFAPQKGASKKDVDLLEQGLAHYAEVMESEAGVLAKNLPGSGAAGGVPFGLAAVLGAGIISGFQWLAKSIDLKDKVSAADVVICAEGKLDSQSLSGKAAGELATMCKNMNKQLLAIPAVVDQQVNWNEHGIAAVQASARPGQEAALDDISTSTTQLLKSVFK